MITSSTWGNCAWFKVSASGREPLNVRFNPVAMAFHWPPDAGFSWSQLMFEPKVCMAKLRMSN